MASDRLFRTLAGLAGIAGQLALVIYYSGALVPSSLMVGTAAPTALSGIVEANHDAIFADAWLQSVGALLSVVFFVSLVRLSGAGNRFSGWMTFMASTLLVAVALFDATFALEAANAATLGDTQTAQVAFNFVAGGTEAFDYAFLFVPAPLLIISLGAALLGSDVLPRVLGYFAIAIGVAFVGLGVASLVSPLSGTAGGVFEVIQVVQVFWVMVSASLLIFRRPPASPPSDPS